MPEYTYLLDTRLSSAQKNALAQVRDAAREAGMTVFLAGGAVRDLTTGSSVRDLDFAVQGNALELREALQARGATFWGQHEPSRTLFFFFPGSVRIEVASTRSESFPKTGQPVYEWSGIVDDLHRRDFTANAMALSLNEGSYGLLLDPLNGVADIEARQLRLVSNYGFLEDPARLVRLVRLRQRLGWTVEERTATRYENAKEADNFDVLSAFRRGYELEEIATEEDALAALRALDAEGWMAKLFAPWTPASANAQALEELSRNRIQLLIQGIAPDLTAAHLELLTAKMSERDRANFKAAMARPGLKAQWEGLDEAAREFARLLTGKDAATSSATWKLFHSHAAEPILWLAHGRKTPAVEAKFKNLFTVWPEIAKKVPVAMMLELRITPELPGYDVLLHELFLQQIDGRLETDEAMRAFLEPYSPPAPPPPVTLRRARGKKGDGKAKRKGALLEEDEDEEDDSPEARDEEDEDEEEDETAGAPPELGLGRSLAAVDLDAVLGRIHSDEEEPEELPDRVTDEEEIAGETIPPAALAKDEPAAEPPAPPSPPRKAAAAGSPPVTPAAEPVPDLRSDETETSAPRAEKTAKSEKKAAPANKAGTRAPSAPPMPAAKKADAPKQAEPTVSAKQAVGAKAVPPAKKTNKTAPAGKAAAPVQKPGAKPQKKAASKAAKPGRKP